MPSLSLEVFDFINGLALGAEYVVNDDHAPGEDDDEPNGFIMIDLLLVRFVIGVWF